MLNSALVIGGEGFRSQPIKNIRDKGKDPSMFIQLAFNLTLSFFKGGLSLLEEVEPCISCSFPFVECGHLSMILCPGECTGIRSWCRWFNGYDSARWPRHYFCLSKVLV